MKGGFFVYFSFKQKTSSKVYLNYTLAFLVVAFFVYGTYLITGHELIWYLDGANQHLPLLQNFRSAVLDFLHHPFEPLEQWSFKMGLGSDTFQVYSYYSLGDIFSYLIILFPASKIVLGYQYLIVFRLYCAGLAFCFLARHFNFSQKIIVSGALVYLFNAFLLYSNIAQPFFTTPFILFPLLIVGIERILQGKSHWFLTFIFTWMLLSNYYFAFVLGIGAFIYLVLRFFIYYRQQKDWPKMIAKLALATILSLLMSAIMLIPEILAVTNSTRSATTFANGLKVYPLYYYLALPSQLINGGNRDFYFWSALGFASISFFAILYVLAKAKKYPLLTSVFGLSLVMLAFPCFGAFFNGMMSPSNRWTLMLVLPVSLSVCLLLSKIKSLSPKMLRYFTFSLLIYTAICSAIYYFQSDEKLFIPMLFLFISLGGIYLAKQNFFGDNQKALLLTILANVCLNALYYEAPYNGGYSDEMLATGAYDKLQTNQFFGLDQDLTATDQYRVSTTSQNYDLGANYHLHNALNSSVNQISSYYSIQNKFVGIFANNMQNLQYEANIPLAQVDDRTILNNFLGVKYLFNQLNQPNDDKIPAGYTLTKATRKVSDINQQTSKDQQVRMFSTDNAFPLVYFQNRVITPKQYAKLSSSQKERALASGVVVDKQIAHSLTQANLTKQVIDLDYQIISSRGNLVDPSSLTKEDPAETYQIILQLPDDQATLNLLKSSELHLELSDISYQPFSLDKQVKLETQKQTNDLTKGFLASNSSLASYKYLRTSILQGSPDNSFSLSVTSNLGTEKITQPKQSALSFYKVVKDTTMNIGYFNDSLPTSLKLTPSKLGTYHFKLKVVAIPLNQTYTKEVQKIQQNALQDLTFKTNQVSGNITTTSAGILTSSIPYSKGWTANVDGQKVPVLKTNQAFIGVKLNAGKHQVTFSYQTPGLLLGAKISLLGIILTLLCWLLERFKIKFYKNTN